LPETDPQAHYAFEPEPCDVQRCGVRQGRVTLREPLIDLSRRTAGRHDSTMRASMREALLLAVVAVACTGGDAVSSTPSVTPTQGEVKPAPSRGQLVLAVSRRGGYDEGSFFYLKIRTDAGKLVLGRTYPAADTEFVVQKSLAPGTYSILSYERPCDAACPRPDQVGALDPPTSRCKRVLTIESSETYHLPVVTGPGLNGCPTY
jgi:hypothetical protein